MKYVCLVYTRPETFAAMSDAETDAMQRAAAAFDEELEERGHLVFAQALDEVDRAITLRLRDGRLSATDGPFAETAEHLGGLTVIEARDLNEALAIAERHPMLPYATIELRPMWSVRDVVDARAGAAGDGRPTTALP